MNKTTEPIPCPFCGRNDVELQNSFAGSKKPVCMDCGASLHPSRSEEAAIHEWNTRVYPAEVQKAIERDIEREPVSLGFQHSVQEFYEEGCASCGCEVAGWMKFCPRCGQRLDWSEG